MEQRYVIQGNDKKVVYYMQGFSESATGDETDPLRREILVVASPFPTIKFCLTLFEGLVGTCRVIGIEYNAHNDDGRILSEEECRLPAYVDSLHAVLERERIEKAHFFCWCQGAKVVLAYYDRHPEKFKSIVGIAVDYRKADWTYASKLEYDDIDKAKKILAVLRAAGNHFLARQFLKMRSKQMTKKDPQLSEFRNLIFDVAANGVRYAHIFKPIIQSPEMVANYFKMSDGVAGDDLTEIVRRVDVPFTILHGTEDRILPLNDRDTELFRSNERIDYRVIQNRTHFMLLDEPAEIVPMIVDAIRKACGLVR